jgi:hypothetical protein
MAAPAGLAALSGIAMLAAFAFGSVTEARADVEYPWCLVPSAFTVGTCTYATHEQCMAAASGNIGSCARNSRYTLQTQQPQTRTRN